MLKLQFHCVYFLTCLSIVSRSHVITSHPSWMLLDHDRCGHSMSDRIIGGKNAAMGAYPWIARIAFVDGVVRADPAKEEEWAFRCGGVLINRMYVITAAHCATNLPGNTKVVGVRLGEHNTETNPDCENGYCAEPVQDIAAEQIFVHHQYGQPAYKNDIAIIRLERAVTLNDWVMPVCLPSGKILNQDFVNETAEVAGWGVYDLSKPISSVILQTLSLPIVPIETCTEAYKFHTTIGPDQLCVGGQMGFDSCAGDSGGPLTKPEAGETGPRYYLIGIVSFGTQNCGESSAPAVYTKISHFLSWILDNISP